MCVLLIFLENEELVDLISLLLSLYNKLMIIFNLEIWSHGFFSHFFHDLVCVVHSVRVFNATFG